MLTLITLLNELTVLKEFALLKEPTLLKELVLLIELVLLAMFRFCDDSCAMFLEMLSTSTGSVTWNVVSA